MQVGVQATLVAPIRDVGAFLHDDIVHLNHVLAAVFTSYRIHLVESDSCDNTVEVLESLASSSLIHSFQSLGALRDRYPVRCDRIALARNTGLSAVRSLYNSEYFLFADLDGVNQTLTAEGIRSCFKYTGWSAMLANQYRRYYDIWALRHPAWCPGDCWEEYRQMVPSFGEELAQWIAVGAKQVHIPSTGPPIKVTSAFGGFGIYKAHAVRGASWSGLTPDGVEVVDWLSFNRDVVGPLVINPLMQNTGSDEHYVSKPPWY